jgi:hypothetical protein
VRGSASDVRKKRKDADARRQTTKELAGPSGGALETATVLRVFFKRQQV